MKTVTRIDFDEFIKEYPRKLDVNQHEGVLSYNDFTLGDLSCSKVAKVNLNLHEGGFPEYLIKSELNNIGCDDSGEYLFIPY